MLSAECGPGGDDGNVSFDVFARFDSKLVLRARRRHGGWIRKSWRCARGGPRRRKRAAGGDHGSTDAHGDERKGRKREDSRELVQGSIKKARAACGTHSRERLLSRLLRCLCSWDRPCVVTRPHEARLQASAPRARARGDVALALCAAISGAGCLAR